jgi:superfamily II DNA or RNA helicase
VSYLFPPGLEDDTIEARPYQADALDRISAEFARGVKATACVHATGTGKSLVIAKAARRTAERGGRTLVLAPRSELIWQNTAALVRVGAVVGSVASLKDDRLESFPPDYFRLICVDEGHHVMCPSQMAILGRFPRARVVLFTATYHRGDGQKLDDVAESIAHEYDLESAMKAPDPGPYLTRFRAVRKDIGIDLRELKKRKGDYSDEDLDARIAPLAADFANAIRQEVGDRPTLVFTPGVRSAMAVAAALRSIYGDDRADWVDGVDPLRDEKVARFRGDAKYQGEESQFLCCNQLLTEGVDLPRCSAAAMMRPTENWGLFMQMLGRPLRLCHGKSDALIVDFAWLTKGHDLMGPEDAYLKPGDDRMEVRRAMRRGAGADVLSVVEKVRASKPSRREVAVDARPRDVADVRREEFEPFAGAPEPARRLPYMARAAEPTPRMVAFLKANGHPEAANYPKGYAGWLIGFIKRKQDADAVREAV